MGTRYTAETVFRLQRRYSGVNFVWLMGADNLASFHRWDRWTTIMQSVPIGVIARPGDQLAAGLSPAAARFARHRLPMRRAAALALRHPPCWTLLIGPTMNVSSTQIRNAGHW